MTKCVLILLAFIAVSCSRDNKQLTVFSDTAMTMNYKIIVGKSLSYSEKSRVKKLITRTFEEIDTIYNKWNPHSEVSRLNHLKGKTRVFLSPELESFLCQVDNIITLCQNRFDPTIEPIQKLWKKRLKNGTIPKLNEIISLSRVVGWQNIHVESGLFWKNDDKCALDLGGIAKGYAVDLLVERLDRQGYKNVFVEWGGEIRATGEHPDKRPWAVYISRFDDPTPENALAFLELKDTAIATSGDYIQNWTVKDDQSNHDWTTYFHIFDIQKKTPLIANHKSIASVTVLAPTCALADALATTVMTFKDINTAKNFTDSIQEEDPSIIFWIVTRNDLQSQKIKKLSMNHSY